MAVTLPNTETLTRNQAARRDRVIKAAMTLAAEGGYDAVQMRDVAATAKVALGTIYRYFASKDHLLASAQLEWVTDLRQRLAQRPPRGDTPAERVGDIARRTLKAQERAPRLAAALVTAIASPDPAVSDVQQEVQAILGDILRTGMEGIDPELQEGAVRVLRHVWFSALLAWVNGWAPSTHVADELQHAATLLLPAAGA